ncbi:MAG: peptide chain release factor N(5)-glutamine methyltransferase [Gammaproteobacteria bacterium]|nr:peptide chain release factor N(5)-glutamine methyltransferase [Gammaproteobacteria bacterium]
MADTGATIAGCVAHARRRLPRYEADLLVSRSLGVPRSHLYAFGERVVDPASSERVAAAVARRQDGEPVAYILGERGFWGLDLEISPDVLVPRGETETLVATALPLIAAHARVLDLGTGSGAIALAIASERTDATVVATDIDPACIDLCRRNAERLGIAVETRVVDCLEGLEGRFDVIVSNPPYVDDRDPRLQRGDLRFEPRCALQGGPNGGLDFIARLVGAAPDHLQPGGWLCVEHGYDQAERVARLFDVHAYCEIQCHLDYEARPRVTVGSTGRYVGNGLVRPGARYGNGRGRGRCGWAGGDPTHSRGEGAPLPARSGRHWGATGSPERSADRGTGADTEMPA